MVSLVEYTADPYWVGTVEMDPGVLLASATDIPVKPPKKWFDDPGLTRLTPLTIEADGRVFGHIASWDGSHIGRLGKVKPPRSKSQYQYFRTGVIETDDGSMVPVGQITLSGGHAPLEASARDAVAHYDDTRSAVMDVAIGEDRHGIWVGGGLRPDVNDIQIRAVRASAVSGDWRPINNQLELVAICSVNVPGFPIPRALAADALDEDGHLPIYALVAAGVESLVALSHKDPTVEALEFALLDIETKMSWMRASLAVLASAAEDEYDDEEQFDDDDTDDTDDDDTDDTDDEGEGGAGASDPADSTAEGTADGGASDPDDAGDAAGEAADPAGRGLADVEEQLVFSFTDSLDGETLAQEILTASASDLLWSDGLPIQFTLPQCEAVALRLKFRKSFDIDTQPRVAALRAGAAMPDGRLPILTDEDLYQALLIVPEATEAHAHISRRAVALGFDLAGMQQDVLTAAADSQKYNFGQRLKMVKTGEAMKGGAFPIKDEEDLKNAIQSYGRSKDKAAAKAHIMKRARALKKVDLLPDKWED